MSSRELQCPIESADVEDKTRYRLEPLSAVPATQKPEEKGGAVAEWVRASLLVQWHRLQKNQNTLGLSCTASQLEEEGVAGW